MKYPTYELEDNLKAKGYRYITGIDEAGRGCEKPDAEILTKLGWKYYTELSLNDLVLSYTDNDTIEWQSIDEIIEKDFDGELVRLKNRSVDIEVTPDHHFDVLKRVSKRDKKDDNKLSLVGYKFRGRKSVLALVSNDVIPRGGKWIGEDADYFILPSIKKKFWDFSGKDYTEKLIPMNVWVAFMGIYLSEGSTSHSDNGSYEVKVSQNKGTSYNKIYNLCKKLPFDVFKEKKGIVIRHKQLYTYLKQFGKCYDKYIPDRLKKLSPRLLRVLIDWLILGDGSCYKGKNRKKVCTYYTTSKRLKDDFEEVVLKAGWSYKTSIRQPRDGFIRGRLIKKENCVPCYETRIRRNIRAQVKSLHKIMTQYKGKVFCLCLPKYHNFYVRRDGSGYFTGNCGAGPVVASAVRIPGKHVGKYIGRVNDSKKLSDKKRRELYKEILDDCDCGTGIVGNITIDDINILEATKLAMYKAVKGMRLGYCDYVLVDGTVELNCLDVPHQQVIKGDNTSVSIAAASIIAKVTRDDIMEQLHYIYPIYGWIRNKAYLTKEHIEAIKQYGVTEFHRTSFNKVGG